MPMPSWLRKNFNLVCSSQTQDPHPVIFPISKKLTFPSCSGKMSWSHPWLLSFFHTSLSNQWANYTSSTFRMWPESLFMFTAMTLYQTNTSLAYTSAICKDLLISLLPPSASCLLILYIHSSSAGGSFQTKLEHILSFSENSTMAFHLNKIQIAYVVNKALCDLAPC